MIITRHACRQEREETLFLNLNKKVTLNQISLYLKENKLSSKRKHLLYYRVETTQYTYELTN